MQQTLTIDTTCSLVSSQKLVDALIANGTVARRHIMSQRHVRFDPSKHQPRASVAQIKLEALAKEVLRLSKATK
jgi:hypothetical protein